MVKDNNGDTPLDLAKLPVHGKPVAELIHYLELVEERMELETNTVHSNYDSNYDSQDDFSRHSKDYNVKDYDSQSYDSDSMSESASTSDSQIV